MSGSGELSALMSPAVAVELVHMASLVHDDILDQAQTRRGRPSVYAQWGPSMATATGDFLFSEAFEVIAGCPVAEASQVLAETSLDLTLGELLQRRGAGTIEVGRDEYLERIRAKTASLFRASCRLGALASGAGSHEVEALSSYGERLGMAFQIFDDVLDVSGDSELLGKQVGADFRDGTLTLPMMLAVEEVGDDRWLRRVFAGVPSEETVSEAIDTVRATGAIQKAKETARCYVGAAAEAVEGLEGRRLRRVLLDIGNYVIERYD